MPLTREEGAEVSRLIVEAQELYRRLGDELDDDEQRLATWMEILNIQQQIDDLLPAETGPIGG